MPLFTMRAGIVTVTLFAALLFGAGEARAQQDRLCNDVCRAGTATENGSACNESCGVCTFWIQGPDGPLCQNAVWSTCGADGVCDACPSAWVEVFRQQVGGFEKNWFNYCEYWVVYDVIDQDVNGCRPNRTRCDEALDARLWGWDVNCCMVQGQCYGKQSC